MLKTNFIFFTLTIMHAQRVVTLFKRLKIETPIK
jgi:hypothetical protein